jgi:uncharacterized protein YjiS (DUF1127 family)
MTTIEQTARPAASFIGIVFDAIALIVRAAAQRRRQRIALAQLLSMSPERLDDLGLNPQDIVDAFDAPPPAGPRLEARRAVAALRPVSA